MEIRKVGIEVEELLRGATYLGSGASKEAYLKDNTVYKIPRGRMILQQSEFLSEDLTFPSEMEEVDGFLEEVCEWEEQMVWPLGQFAIELIVWEKLMLLEKEGLNIDFVARVKDYYITSDGVLVIEQELADRSAKTAEEFEKASDSLYEELDLLEPILNERFGIRLGDVRSGNCGFTEEGKYKLYDFGISTTTSLDSYGSYSDYGSYYSCTSNYNSCSSSC